MGVLSGEAFPVKDEVRGERILNSPQLTTVLVVPKFEPDEQPDVIISESVRDLRAISTSSSSKRNIEESRANVKIWQPEKSAPKVLEEYGLKLRAGEDHVSLNPGDNGYFDHLKHLNLSVAHFTDRDGPKRLIDSIKSSYDVVEDYQLSLPEQPTPLPGDTDGFLENEQINWGEHSGVEDAHKSDIQGEGVLIAVLDSGVDADHREFKRRIRFRYFPLRGGGSSKEMRGFDPDGHGTHVCSILAGRNAGIVPKARLFAGAVLEAESIATSIARVSRGLDWLISEFLDKQAQKKPKILNLSLGYPSAPPQGSDKDSYRRELRTFRRTIKFVADANILVVAAIGNNGEDEFRVPACDPHVLGVGAVTKEHDPCNFSGNVPDGLRSTGLSGPEIVGYGESVYGAYGRGIDGQNRYRFKSGTSQAVPYVSGIAALYWSALPELAAGDVKQLLMDTAFNLQQSDPARVGAGLARYDASALGGRH